DRRAAVGSLHATPGGDLVEDRLRDLVAGAERIRELLALDVQERRAVGAGGLRDRIALHVRRPGAAVRVVLKRVEVAGFGAQVERDLRHFAGCPGVIGRTLAPLLGLAVAAATGREHDRPGVDHVLPAAGPPAVRGR